MTEIEQRYAISFLLRKQLQPKDIISEIQRTYGDDAYCAASIYFWIKEIKCGRKSLSNIPSEGRPLDDDVDYVISEQLKLNPHISARKIAKKAHCSISTVLNHLHHVFGLKSLHLKWVPQRLNYIQKELRVQYSKMILNELKKARKKKYKFILTGDESWFRYSYTVNRMWVIDFEEVDEIVEKSLNDKKTMVTIFINGQGLQLIDVKPEKVKITSEYFIENILKKIEKLEIAEKAKTQRQRLMIHFDNAPSHSSKIVKDFLKISHLFKLDHPAYSPDLAPCDFGLFGTMKEYFEDKEFETEEELFEAIMEFFNGKSKEFWISLFDTWIKRLEKCIEVNGNYFK